MSNILYLSTGPISIEGDNQDVSDGNHTFKELYDHRVLLFLALMVTLPKLSWIAKFHEDGTSYEGSFLAGMNLPTGTISYHVPVEFLPMLEDKGINMLEYAPPWDGHTSFDVLERLSDYVSSR